MSKNITEFDTSNYDAVVVGAGFAGSVLARELAERKGLRVAVLEQRPHIGGNTYDRYDDTGVLIHEYGPHIFHSNSQRVFDYLQRFTAWRSYEHEVLADIHGTYTPVPFNFNSIEQHFEPTKAQAIIEKLTATFGEGTKVPIIELRAAADELLSELADFVYENVFLYYTMKQWGQTPEEIDPSVTARVPVLVGRDNRYFTDTYQGMPQDGYTVLFENLLAHPLIDVYLNVDANAVLRLRQGGGDKIERILVNGDEFTGQLIYTGPLDRLCDFCYGKLPYRSLSFIFKSYPVKHFFPCGTINYTVSEDYTRVSEYTWLTGQDLDHTTIMEEYSHAFEDWQTQIPYYAIINATNNAHYQRYLDLFSGLPNFYPIGRLAQYRYFNMDQIILNALELADELCA